MTIAQLIIKLKKLKTKGYGKKDIFVSGDECYTQENYHIDSIQKNTHPDVEPDYFIITAGETQTK